MPSDVERVIPNLAIATTTLLFIVLCVVSDVRTLRIPNVITGPAIVTGLAMNAAIGGWSGLAASVAGFAVAVVLLFAPFALGGIGAGDVKMMGAVGALLGPHLVLQSLFVGVILGGIFAVLRLARTARLREKLLATWWMVANAVTSRSLGPLQAPLGNPDALFLPYSVPLALGTLGVVALSMASRS